MDQLVQAREQINRIDREMAELFCRRMEAVREVSAYKSEHGLPVYDGTREEAVIKNNSERITNDEMRSYYVEFLRDTMKISRRYQEKLSTGMRVAFCGVEGAFASIAASKIFPRAGRVPFPDFRSAYYAVVEGECDCAVLPIENSTAGEVGQVVDMMFSGPLFVSGVYDLFIYQHLMSIPGAVLSDIREVISHPQALAQCAPYIKKHGFTQTQFENTAMAAKFVKEKNDPHIAAIASAETAELYGLEILDRNINERSINMTRFAVLTRAAVTESSSPDKHSILMFTVGNEAGALAKAVGIIGKYGFNMRCLRSRPMKELLWQYYFYVEAEGDLGSEKGKHMMEELKGCCDRLKMFGSFRYPAELH